MLPKECSLQGKMSKNEMGLLWVLVRVRKKRGVLL